MLPEPMFGDVAAGAKPDAIAPARMVEKLDQSDRLCRPPDQPIVHAQAHDLGALGTLFEEKVETIDHVLSEFVGRAEPCIAIETIVVGFERIRNHR